MIEYEHFLYLDVPKTGSTHLVELLDRITIERPLVKQRHEPVRNLSIALGRSDKFIFTTVRNPWDWYVSMWAYGYTRENTLFQHILEAFGPEIHGRLYDRSNPRASFSEWLTALNDPAFLHKVLKGRKLPWTGLSGFLGYYSYRFMKVTLPYPDIFLRQPFIWSTDGAIAFQRRWAMYDAALKTETLDADLLHLAEEHGVLHAFKPNASELVQSLSRQKANVSARGLASYRDYYTDTARDIVMKRDRMIVELFDYRF